MNHFGTNAPYHRAYLHKKEMRMLREELSKDFIIKGLLRTITSTPEWILDDIRIEKIISTPIWANKCFFEVSARY